MTDMTFYLVWNPNAGNPQHRHNDLDDAKSEARRLASSVGNLGQEFFVLAAIMSAKRDDPLIIREFDNVPF